MSKAVERLKNELAGLSIEDRAELAHFLLESLPPDDDIDDEAAWVEELNRRMEEIDSGQAVGIPAEQVFAELRLKYPRVHRP
jgi:putative addiction module component (TIGR02574 family)